MNYIIKTAFKAFISLTPVTTQYRIPLTNIKRRMVMKTKKEKVGSDYTGLSLIKLATTILQAIFEPIRRKTMQGRKSKQLKLPIKNTANDPSKF